MKSAILVNGVPASGKSLVARGIAERMRLPLMTLDSVKEPLFAHFGLGDREHNRKLGRASYELIFAAIADWPDGCTAVIDAWFGFQPAEVLDRHLVAAGIGRTAQVWCHAPNAVLASRYAARVATRSAGHPGVEYIPELIALNDGAMPLDRGPTFDVETSGRVPFDDVVAWLGARLGETSGRG